MAPLTPCTDPCHLAPPSISPIALEGQPVAAALAHEAMWHQLSLRRHLCGQLPQDSFSTTAPSPTGDRASLSQLVAPHRAAAPRGLSVNLLCPQVTEFKESPSVSE